MSFYYKLLSEKVFKTGNSTMRFEYNPSNHMCELGYNYNEIRCLYVYDTIKEKQKIFYYM